MARFPESEPEIAALARLLVQGLGQATEDFPAPPVPAEELQAKLDAYHATAAATVVAETALREQHAAKDRALEELVDDMKANLKYAEVAVRDQPEKLSQLGWGPRRSARPLKQPGEVRDIRIVSEGDTWVILSWNPPVDGGPVGAYKIQRKQQDGDWTDVATSVETTELLTNQPRRVEFDYRVIGLNRAGAGQPSATVTVVL
jgi:hypothetical protein